MAAGLSLSRLKGTEAEQQACVWLQRHGLARRESNWACRHGELDLIMEDGDTLVFVEVRLRKHQGFGGAAASVTRAKQKKLAACAARYLATQPELGMRPCRFDVLAMTPTEHQSVHFDWIKNAFYGDEE